jgi:hypothetical protein
VGIPYLRWKAAVEEEVAIGFNVSTGVTMLVRMGVPSCMFCRGKCSAYESPGKGFDEEGKIFALPCSLEYQIALGLDASRPLHGMVVLN